MAASALIQAFLGFFLPVLCTIFFPGHWLLSHVTIVETMDSNERGINPVAMTHQSLELILVEQEIKPVRDLRFLRPAPYSELLGSALLKRTPGKQG